ncbi:hypothetical protein CASFOL_029834 [Castilleja foliolosa]|uniref:PHD-type domain-containing protein n=1 Tax=Castilleja foliolosa TaxID=1961234 RepID=A0ABD3C8Y4_9LAMI
MEGTVISGGVLKKKSSSGCLIIKKKVENGNSGLGGSSISNIKEKKRPRFVGSDSNASDDDESSEFMRRKRGSSSLYDFDGKRTRNEYADDRFRIGGHNSCSENLNSKNFGVGFSGRNSMVDKRAQNSYLGGSSSGKRTNFGDYLEEENNTTIRLQGKNGVLKVMVNKKKKVDLHSHHHRKYDPRDHVVPKKDLSPLLPVYPSPNTLENRGLLVEKEIKGVNLEKIAKPVLDVTDTSLKLALPGPQACSSKKGVKREEEKTHSENVKVKAKRVGSTEKQMLREKIRGMLLESGWTIDYRPRRNRDYLDSVYISPSGTAYWSIIKAYEAFKKQLDEDSTKKAPLSEDLINKLTRQTKKKIEEEMKRKRKDGLADKSNVRASGESSDSEIKSQKGKSLKVDQESDDDVSDDSPKKKPRQLKVGKVIGRCTLLARGSDGYVPYSGKRTLLAWLIDSGTTRLGEKVQYMNRRRNKVKLEGWITRDGIHCCCCSKILTVSKFELHAASKLRQPFQNIFLESGVSLLQCQLDAWNKQEESFRRYFYTVDGDDPDDDTCGLCGDGGALICCDSCPSTFHQLCLEIQMLPSGDWHCPNCVCKFNDSAAYELTRCSFCEKKYHESCVKDVNALPMGSSGLSFCGLKCQELYDHLQKILGVKHELEAGFSWSFIQRTDVSDTLHRSFPLRVECNSKLAVVLSVMDECFLPVIDRRSGFNMVHNVVYNCGSNFNRLNYSGFYTAILERGDEIVAAASIRIHGTCLAEMPFIATREIYRRQGMCRRLFSAIETELRFLKVEKLIIPAISEHKNTWTTTFGTNMLQKQLENQEISCGTKLSESVQKQPQIEIIENELLENNNSSVEAVVDHRVDIQLQNDRSTPGVVLEEAVNYVEMI